MDRSQRTGVLFTLISAVSFGCLPILIKIAYQSDPTLDSLSVLLWRFIFATPVIWMVAAALEASSDGLARWKLFAAGVLFAPNSVCAFLGLALIPASTYTALFYTYPAMVALMSLLVGERLSWAGWAALLLTLAGTALTAGGDLNASVLGMMFALLNAFFYAITLVVSGRLLRGQTALITASAWSISGTLVALSVLALGRGVFSAAEWQSPNLAAFVLTPPGSVASLLVLVGLAVIGTVIALSTLYIGIKRIGAARAAIFSTIEPISTLLLAVLLLGETMRALQWVGAGLIVFSVILLQIGGKKQERRGAVPAGG